MVRYVAKFRKDKGVKYISHLDLMRCFERAIRRAEIPISYSKGFNPHPEISFATPLPVGISSTGEYMDFRLEIDVSEETLIQKMNQSLPGDICLVGIKKVDDKFCSLMSAIDGALYDIALTNVPPKVLMQDVIDSFLCRPSIEIVKSGKKGDKLINIRPMIYFMTTKGEDNEQAVFNATLAAGSRENLSPELLVRAMKIYINDLDKAEVRDITKIETYIIKDNCFLTPMEIS